MKVLYKNDLITTKYLILGPESCQAPRMTTSVYFSPVSFTSSCFFVSPLFFFLNLTPQQPQYFRLSELFLQVPMLCVSFLPHVWYWNVEGVLRLSETYNLYLTYFAKLI